jgi:hypothetical protein
MGPVSPRAAVLIDPVPADKSLQNGNIRGNGRKLLAISASSPAKRESRDESECAKSRDFRPILASVREPGLTPEWVAGAKGFEPRYGELEIRPSRLFEGIPKTALR